jgi:hypothetical protein
VHTAQVDAQLHDGGSLRATFRMADKQEACDAADEFVRLNEPIIENAATSVTENVNGRFDNTVMEEFADMIYERHSSEDDGWTQDEIDAAIREHEGTLFLNFVGPVVTQIEDFIAQQKGANEALMGLLGDRRSRAPGVPTRRASRREDQSGRTHRVAGLARAHRTRRR